ncbi:MAG: CotH kinase family protein [Polyangiaceae bacterium]
MRTELGPRWRVLRGTVFSNAAITQRLDGYASILSNEAIARNFALWPIEDVDFQQIYSPFSFYDVSSYAEEMTHLRNWITQRLQWIDSSIDSYPAK